MSEDLSEYEALRDRLEAFDCVFCIHPADMACKCACHEAGRAFVAIDVLLAENVRLEGMAEGNAGCAERAYLARDAAQQREAEALAHVRALTRERDEARASLALHCSCDEDAPHKPDCIVVLRDTMRGMEEEIEERERERDVARDETRIVEEGRAAWERECSEARAELARLTRERDELRMPTEVLGHPLREIQEALDFFETYAGTKVLRAGIKRVGEVLKGQRTLIAEQSFKNGKLEAENAELRKQWSALQAIREGLHQRLAEERVELTRERESDYAQALAHRKGLTAKLDMAEAELARLRAAVEFACKQRCGPFLDYGRHAPECLAYELLPDESQARSAEQPGGGT